MVVPMPISDCIRAVPPNPAALAFIFFSPLPGWRLLVLNPFPLSWIDKVMWLLLADKEIEASEAMLYFAILLMASFVIKTMFFLNSCPLQAVAASLEMV
jgi:hypothetical protein